MNVNSDDVSYNGNLAEWLWRRFQDFPVQQIPVRKSEGSNPSVVIFLPMFCVVTSEPVNGSGAF